MSDHDIAERSVTRSTSSTRSSPENSDCLSMFVPMPTISSSTSRLLRSITLR